MEKIERNEFIGTKTTASVSKAKYNDMFVLNDRIISSFYVPW